LSNGRGYYVEVDFNNFDLYRIDTREFESTTFFSQEQGSDLSSCTLNAKFSSNKINEIHAKNVFQTQDKVDL